MAASRCFDHDGLMAMTYPDALAVAAPESLAFASPASVKRLAIDVAVSTIESSFFLPLASARTIVGAEARRALLSPLFITLNGALILALARTIGAVDREEFLAFSRTRNSGLMQLARQSAFDAQTRECRCFSLRNVEWRRFWNSSHR